MNSKTPQLVVMITKDDRTVDNAFEIFEKCKNTKANYWGFKEESLPADEMKRLFRYMKECGKTTSLEVVQYDEKAGLEGAAIAAECGCDILMGTVYFPSIHQFCREHGLKYMPFVGEVTERPSILGGSIDGMIAQGQDYAAKGVDGIDLLSYRYVGDQQELNRRFVSEVELPVCIAGSVDCYEKLDELLDCSPWSFTIGGAFFDKKFGTEFDEQINTVCDYMAQGEKND
ncbi:MAG: hypothetical protein IJI47_03970 [Eubacterium sp.]|nr:hypothetical protein [Eubacterium sp.]MBR0412704.1 hypothetical protein [Eubacterium sp.]